MLDVPPKRDTTWAVDRSGRGSGALRNHSSGGARRVCQAARTRPTYAKASSTAHAVAFARARKAVAKRPSVKRAGARQAVKGGRR